MIKVERSMSDLCKMYNFDITTFVGFIVWIPLENNRYNWNMKQRTWKFLTHRSQICANGNEDCNLYDTEELSTIHCARKGETETDLPLYVTRQWWHLDLSHRKDPTSLPLKQLKSGPVSQMPRDWLCVARTVEELLVHGAQMRSHTNNSACLFNIIHSVPCACRYLHTHMHTIKLHVVHKLEPPYVL